MASKLTTTLFVVVNRNFMFLIKTLLQDDPVKGFYVRKFFISL